MTTETNRPEAPPSADRLAIPDPPPKRSQTAWAAIVGGVILVSAITLDIDWSELWTIPGETQRYGQLMFSDPDWGRLRRALFETWRSVSMAWLGAILCVVLSVPLGILAARGVGPIWVRVPLRALFAVIRAVPEVVIALLLLTVTGLTPLTGVLALGLAGIGTQAKWVYESVESVSDGAPEAVVAAGGTTAQLTRWAVWPAIAPIVMSFALYRFEINIRVSAVLGLVGAGGIGSMLNNSVNFRQWDTVGMLLIVVIIATMIVDAVSGAIRRRIMEGARA